MAFEELKKSQGEMWGAGPFEQIEAAIADMHDSLVEKMSPRPGETWLDVGCGTGAVAMSAARAGAKVTGLDLAPALIDTARIRTQEAGLEVDYETGDCENLRFGDGSFDAVSSSVGVMFAPNQETAAKELARVTAPGGRLGLTTWRPDGRIGEMFRLLGEFRPAPPEGVGNPLDWGREEYVEGLLGDAFDLEFESMDTPYEIESGEKYWDIFSHAFGPTKVLAESLEGADRERFRQAFIDFVEDDRDGDMIRQSRTYLLTTGTRRA